uniref:Uncharacterized protein n=1 Tax=Anguilla anguilla TaxID=7936 RepID=A0A0E9SVF0_ANGAN
MQLYIRKYALSTPHAVSGGSRHSGPQ